VDDLKYFSVPVTFSHRLILDRNFSQAARSFQEFFETPRNFKEFSEILGIFQKFYELSGYFRNFQESFKFS
jgi:hypothetical protein